MYQQFLMTPRPKKLVHATLKVCSRRIHRKKGEKYKVEPTHGSLSRPVHRQYIHWCSRCWLYWKHRACAHCSGWAGPSALALAGNSSERAITRRWRVSTWLERRYLCTRMCPGGLPGALSRQKWRSTRGVRLRQIECLGSPRTLAG